MATAPKRRIGESSPIPTGEPPFARASVPKLRMGLGLGLTLVLGLVFALLMSPLDMTAVLSLPSVIATKRASTSLSTPPPKAETRLTRESIDLLLAALDQATRRKDVEGVLEHIAPSATITIHMKQGSQQQIATLTRDEYRTTLQMSFAFPSAHDYTRVGTTVSLAPDERSAKVSFKSTETLRHARRDLKVEGDETLIFKVLDDRPMIVSLEQVVPGDST
jgi:hypothetical protein